MTLIIAGGNQKYIVLMSDRRLTSDAGIEDEEANKAIVLATSDARLAIAFTGLARWKKFDTLDWLREIIRVEVENYRDIDSMLQVIVDSANTKFKSFGRGAKLAIVLIGYLYDYSNRKLRCWEISNFEHEGGFELKSYFPDKKDNAVLFQIAGDTRAITEKKKTELIDMLGGNVPPLGFETKCYSIIRDYVRKNPAGVIGEQCTACCIESLPNSVIKCTYYSKFLDYVVYSPTTIMLGTTTYNAEFHVGSDAPPPIVPKVHRNSPCPCGSGRAYKRCHRHLDYHYLPFSSEITISPGFKDLPEGQTEFPSGHRFIVRTRGAAGRRS